MNSLMFYKDNNIGKAGALYLNLALKHNVGLQTINLNRTSILQITLIISLNIITGNQIGDEGAKCIADALEHNSTLQTLRISGTSVAI